MSFTIRMNDLKTVSNVFVSNIEVTQQRFVSSNVIVKSGTVNDILPDPKNEYTVTYERIVLDNDYDLSKLPSNAVIDIWRTHPTLEKRTIAALSNTVEILGSSTLRDLDSNVNVYSPDVFTNTSRQVFATAAEIGMQAIGPQDQLLYTKYDPTPKLVQHTNFSIVQREIKISNPPYIGNVLTIAINPRECGDLISYMYLKCSLPPNINYTPHTGRAIIQKAELYLNEKLIDYYDDDWAIIHDELFMSADEMLALDQVLTPPNMIIPLKFFFCNKDKYLHACTLKSQFIYIKLYFSQQSWFTDYTEKIELQNMSILFDQIFITAEERNYYRTNKIETIIPRVYRETPENFTRGFVNINMSANFKVNMINWFIRNTNYEVGNDFTRRYSYGYVSDYVNSYTKFTNWRGQVVNYLQVIDFIELYIDNKNIISGLTGDIYYTYKQPMEHGLSVPDKTIYTYCFSAEPKNHVKGGEVDFGKQRYSSTSVKIKFLDSLAPQLVENYRLYLYYYGYSTFVIDTGFGEVVS